MLIKTRDFGLVEIDEADIIKFPSGIPGFEGFKQYVILQDKTDENPFRWLQSVEEGGPTFIVMEPKVFLRDYNPEVSLGVVREIELEKEEDALIYLILTIPEDMDKMTANLRGPIIINGTKGLGKQVVLEQGDYSTKHPVMPELKKQGQASPETGK